MAKAKLSTKALDPQFPASSSVLPPLKNKKSIGISGSRQEEPTIRVERNGLRVGGDAEKPCIMETSQNEFYEERKGRVSVLQRAQVTKGQDVKRK